MENSNDIYDKWLSEGEREGVITIFTPTYNRVRFLARLYDILLRQTDRHFVWIVVNDGSNDNTHEVVWELLERNEMPILYVSKKNGGKHSAFRVALERTETEYFIGMDDDDTYSEQSIETFLKLWKQVKTDGDESIGAIRTLARKSDGSFASNIPMEEDYKYVDRTTLEQKYIYRIRQENWTCYRTSCLLQVDLFPQDYWLSDQHTFFVERLWQGRFARKYKCRYVNVALRNYTDDAEISLSRTKKNRQHYINRFINTKMTLDEQFDFMRNDIPTLLESLLIVSILQHKLDIPIKSLLRNTENRFLRICYVVLYPMTWLSTKPSFSE